MVSTSLPDNSESIVVDPNSFHSLSLPTDSPLPTVEMDTSTSSDLDLPIAH